MLSWIFKKLAGSAIGSVLAPFKMYFIAAAIAGLLAWVGIHLALDSSRKAKLIVLEASNTQLIAANDKAEVQNTAQANRLKAHNVQLLADIAAAAERVKAAEIVTERVRVERDQISEQLAITKFSILENMQNDSEYSDWIYGNPPAGVWLQIDAIKNGLQP